MQNILKKGFFIFLYSSSRINLRKFTNNGKINGIKSFLFNKPKVIKI